MIRYKVNEPETGSYTALIHADQFTADYQKPKDAAFLAEIPAILPGWTATESGIFYETPPTVEGYARHTATREALHEVFTEYYRRFGSQIYPNNEPVLESLVRADVLCCVSGIVEFCLSSEDRDSPFKWDDAENLTATVYAENQWRAIWDAETQIWTYYRIDEDGDDEEKFSVYLSDIKGQFPEDLDEEETTPDHDKVIAWKGYRSPENVLEEGEEPESDEENAEIFEWWALDSRLWNWLKDAGQVVIDSNLRVWGRQTTGQGIALDSVIARVAREHGILYGQKNEWDRK